MFYEYDDDKYNPLKIVLKDVVRYYNDCKDNGKTMNFKLDDDSLDKIIDISEYIEEKLKIHHNNFTYESKSKIILKQKYLMKHALEKTRMIKPI